MDQVKFFITWSLGVSNINISLPYMLPLKVVMAESCSLLSAGGFSESAERVKKAESLTGDQSRVNPVSLPMLAGIDSSPLATPLAG